MRTVLSSKSSFGGKVNIKYCKSSLKEKTVVANLVLFLSSMKDIVTALQFIKKRIKFLFFLFYFPKIWVCRAIGSKRNIWAWSNDMQWTQQKPLDLSMTTKSSLDLIISACSPKISIPESFTLLCHFRKVREVIVVIFIEGV